MPASVTTLAKKIVRFAYLYTSADETRLSDRITALLNKIEREQDADIDPLRFLTRKEKIEIMCEFARAMSLVHIPFCVTVCDRLVRFVYMYDST